MIIKQDRTSNNEYLQAGGVWVRNFAREAFSAVQLSHLFEPTDYAVVFKNEELNKNYPKISNENLIFKKILIVSDGYRFEQKQDLIKDMPKDICILAVNGALRKWSLMNSRQTASDRRPINAYVINNPYDEALTFLPDPASKYYPVCVASIRANCQFLKKYLGDIYTYHPTAERRFGRTPQERYTIDDYRNPVCAALGLAYQMQAEKVMLFCCDDSFEVKTEFSVELKNGLYAYPQQLKAQDIIDANLYWLTHQENRKVEVVDYSSGKEYLNAPYISSEEEVKTFFRDQEEGAEHE